MPIKPERRTPQTKFRRPAIPEADFRGELEATIVYLRKALDESLDLGDGLEQLRISKELLEWAMGLRYTVERAEEGR